MKIVLVSDSQDSGFQVVTTNGGEQAMSEISRCAPDLVLVRESIHRLNGDELCIRVRELSDAPIIVLGQSREEADGVEMLEMGADAYLPSPLNPRALVARIRSLLRRSHPTQET